MKSTFSDVSVSKLLEDTSLIRSEIGSFLDASAHVENSSTRDSFQFHDRGHAVDEAISGTFSQKLKAHLSDERGEKQGHHIDSVSSSDSAASLKVASASSAIEVETKQAAATPSAISKTATKATQAAASNEAAAASSGYPDASNTGVPSGTKMTKYTGSYHVTQDNAVISNLEVYGDIVIEAKNVTLKNVKLVSNTEWHALRVMDDATGFTMQDSEIDGQGKTVNAIYGFGTFLRNNLHDVHNGINVIAPTTIKDNYIHDLRGDADAHYDGIEINGGHDINIIHNTIINDHDQTSAVMLNNDFGGLRNITIDGNRLVGGGYTVYLDDRFNGGTVDDSTIKITNNQIGDGHWGDFAFYDNKPVVSGNTDLDTAVAGTVYTGTAGNDALPVSGQTSAGNETYKGLGGNDLLKGGAGADILDGGSGSDTATYAGSTAVKINLQTATASGGHATGDKFVSIENLIGSSYADTLTGNTGNNILNGGAGADKMAGGAGNDTYIVDNAGDVVTEGSKAGTDTVKTSVTYILTSNVEKLAMSGTNAINAMGNSGDNTLKGNSANNGLKGGSGNDIIIGGGGNDTLEGQAGNDTLTGGAGADRFVFRQSEIKTSGADHITDFSSSDALVFDVNSGPTGNLASSAFRLGTAALDSSDRFIYDTKAHSLYYDSDGNGAAAKVLIATFDNGYNLSASDFLLI
nr:calcium-binding protein [uncultured Shinella sp.]